MNLNKIYKNIFLVMVLSLVLSACATQQKASKIDSQIHNMIATIYLLQNSTSNLTSNKQNAWHTCAFGSLAADL